MVHLAAHEIDHLLSGACGTCSPSPLPGEADEASRVISELNTVADRVAAAYGFAKGLGLAAPQVGARVAIVRPPGVEQLILLNPMVLEQSAEADEQYEGCLRFFDVRGLVPRSLAIRVQYDTADGESRTAVFEGLAVWTVKGHGLHPPSAHRIVQRKPNEVFSATFS